MHRTFLILLGLILLATVSQAQQVRLPRAKAPLTLCDLANPQVMARWSGLKCQPATIGGQHGMKFALPKYVPGANQWPAIYLNYGGGKGYATDDWSHYAIVAFDAGIDRDQPQSLSLELRNDPGHNGSVAQFSLLPGKVNHVQIPLGSVGIKLDLARIEELVFFTSRPKHACTITLANFRLLPGQKPPLAEFDLRYPNYRQMVFPGVNRVTVEVTTHPEEYHVRPADLTVALTCSADGVKVTERQPLRHGVVRISAPVSKFPAGPLTLSATLLDARGAALIARQWQLRKLTANEVRGLKVYIDQYNDTIVDGKPFFPLGWYGGGSPQQALEIANSPFNCLLDYGANHKSRAEMLRYLAMLQRHGLKLIYCMNDIYPSATYFKGKSWEGVKGNMAIADAVVAAYRDNPAVLAWYLNDERPRTMAPEFVRYYQRVRRDDPDHPCYIVLCNMAQLRYFVDTTDVMGVDPYPIPTSPVTRVSDWTDDAVRAVHGHKPVWVVPQSFAWYQYNPEGSDRGRIPSAADLRTGRAPTYQESRCMTYLALAHGAKGLIYYCYYDLRKLPQYKEMWAGMKRIAAEVKTLSPVLLSPEDLGPASYSPATAPLHTKLKRCQGREYLIAVNAGQEACSITFSLRGQLPPAAQVMFEHRTVSMAGGKLRDTFKSLEVHVYDLGVVGTK